MAVMKLSEARLCVNCETIHTEWTCPTCSQGPSYFLSNWTKQILDNHQKCQAYLDRAKFEIEAQRQMDRDDARHRDQPPVEQRKPVVDRAASMDMNEDGSRAT